MGICLNEGERSPQDHLCGFVSQYLLATQTLYPYSVPKPQKQKPPRKVRACADARGERSKISNRWEAFAPQKRECPSLSLEESRETFLARKVSRAAFLWYLSFAEAKESTQ